MVLSLLALACLDPGPLAAQSPGTRLTLDAHLAVPMMNRTSLRDDHVGMGLALSYAVLPRLEVVFGADAFIPPESDVCALIPGESCDRRFVRAVGTIAARVALASGGAVRPYVSAGGYSTLWGGFHVPASGQSEEATGFGPSGAMLALGLRMSGAPTARFVGHLEYAALFDMVGEAGGVLRIGVGWRL